MSDYFQVSHLTPVVAQTPMKGPLPMSILKNLYVGINSELEDRANSILREGRRGITALSQKKDYLTEEQMHLRQAREVLNLNGVPDPSIRQGLYRRSYNPLAYRRPHHQCSQDVDIKF